MPNAHVNGVSLFYEEAGTGVPIVFVHGSWTSHMNWRFVVPALAESYRVVTYDRRGHSQSERLPGQGSALEDVADLAALIEHLDLAPAFVAANSFGSSITLRLAIERPELLRGIVIHEPPLLSLIEGKAEHAALIEETLRREAAVVDRIRSGDHEGAAEQFADTVALGPGAWAMLPPPIRQTFIENAPTFADEAADPDQYLIDAQKLESFTKPVLATQGDQSPAFYRPILAEVVRRLPQAESLTYRGAGHIPQTTHPELYVETVARFLGKHAS